MKQSLTPREKRTFCLSYSNTLSDFTDSDFTRLNLPEPPTESEQIFFKEIHNFEQINLDNNGVFLVDLWCEVFLWVGKKVGDDVRLVMMGIVHDVLLKLRKGEKKEVEKVVVS